MCVTATTDMAFWCVTYAEYSPVGGLVPRTCGRSVWSDLYRLTPPPVLDFGALSTCGVARSLSG